jgi:hypothetical protein
MAEKITVRRESWRTPEKQKNHGEHQERISAHHEAGAERSRHGNHDDLTKIMAKIENSAKTSDELRSHHAAPEDKTDYRNPNFVGKQLQENQHKRSLSKIQKELKPYQRPFSTIVHSSVIEPLSDAAEKTVARPNALLAGGLASFVASILVLFLCKYYGYEYNYFIGLMSFPAGFIVGIFGELIFKPIRRR